MMKLRAELSPGRGTARGSRTDGRDLRVEYQSAGYTYVDNTAEFNGLTRQSLPVLGLFESSHMEWEWDRATDAGGEPSLDGHDAQVH